MPSHPSKHSVCFQVERHRFHLPSSSSSSRVCFQDSIPLLCSWRKRGIERERGSEFFVLDKVCSFSLFLPTYLLFPKKCLECVCSGGAPTRPWREKAREEDGLGRPKFVVGIRAHMQQKKKRVFSSSSSCQASLLLT